MNSTTEVVSKKHLQVVAATNIDEELAAFEKLERERLGLDGHHDHWVENMANLTFTKSEKANITMLVSGLTVAHDTFVAAGLSGVGYNVQMIDVPDNAALQYGKEFGNRGQCNPTYFTVGNLVKFLCTLRDKHGMTSEEVVKKYVFLTAGACGPCRFGMYSTEYRKALRDAGFDGFRVVLFQQSGGLSQATGEESGLELNATFFWALVKALFAGDALNALGYRLRPFEVEKGATDRAIAQSTEIICDALRSRTPILFAMLKCRKLFQDVKIDRTMPKPKVGIIGEFWAMTTEGDGNYHLQRFLEGEGAEDDIQLVAAWVLYSVWEGRYDTAERDTLRGEDTSYYGLGGKGAFGAGIKRVGMVGADVAIRVLFQSFAKTIGLHGYKLPDLDLIAEVAKEFYHNDLRGGEGHMEVGKLILNVTKKKNHMTLSVKPFGCMPSAGVSDGVQTKIVERYPGAIYCPVETNGDGAVNFYSRVQMYLYKARIAAQAEFEMALEEHGITKEQFETFVRGSKRFGSSLYYPEHKYAGTTADMVAAVAPYVTMSRAQRMQKRATNMLSRAAEVATASPAIAKTVLQVVREKAPEYAAKAKEDVVIYMEQRRASKNITAVAAE